MGEYIVYLVYRYDFHSIQKKRVFRDLKDALNYKDVLVRENDPKVSRMKINGYMVENYFLDYGSGVCIEEVRFIGE